MTESNALSFHTLASATVTGLSADSTGFGGAVRVGYCTALGINKLEPLIRRG